MGGRRDRKETDTRQWSKKRQKRPCGGRARTRSICAEILMQRELGKKMMRKKWNNSEYGKTGTGDQWIQAKQREAKAGESQERGGKLGLSKQMTRTVGRTRRQQQNWDKKVEKQRLRLKKTRHMIQNQEHVRQTLARSRNGVVWTPTFSYAAPPTMQRTSYVTWTLLTLQNKHKSYGGYFDYVIKRIFSSCCTGRREDLPSVISSPVSIHPWHTSQRKTLPSSWLNIHPAGDCKGCMKTAAHGVPKELWLLR